MTVSIASLPPQIQQRYNAKLLSTPERNNIHNLFATPVELPDNQGFIDRQSRYDRLDLFPVPLDDAQLNPPSQQLNRVDVDCRVRVYATYIVLTKQVTITNEDPVLNSASARLGQALRETQDILQRDNLEARMCGLSKPSLIDLEAYGVSYGDRAQAEQFVLAA
jgi:N4-gp56 family major capsid protein